MNREKRAAATEECLQKKLRMICLIMIFRSITTNFKKKVHHGVLGTRRYFRYRKIVRITDIEM